MFKKILEKIKEYNRIIIHHHIRPDGDCIGSQMGMKHLIKATYPEKEVYAVGGDLPEYLEYIAKHEQVSDELYKDALVIVVDTSKKDRIYDQRYSTGDFLIKIDHHDDSEEFGDLAYVDEKCSACSAIITQFYIANKDELVLSNDAAKALYFGITTDTGRFRYRGVDGDILRSAACLIDSGIDIEDIYTNLYTDDVNNLKLRGYVYKNFKQTENGVLYIYFSNRMMKKYGVSRDSAGNLVNSLDSVKGSIIWVAFIEQDNKDIRVRIRSRYVSINDVARNYRGGGHLQASGATLKHKKELKLILKELDTRCKEYKNEHPEVF